LITRWQLLKKVFFDMAVIIVGSWQSMLWEIRWKIGSYKSLKTIKLNKHRSVAVKKATIESATRTPKEIHDAARMPMPIVSPHTLESYTKKYSIREREGIPASVKFAETAERGERQ